MKSADIQRFIHTVHAIRDNHALGKAQFQAALNWAGGTKNQLSVRRFAPFFSDEPNNFGGDNSAPNPVEYLISAAAACFATGFEWQAAQAGVVLEQFEVRVSGGIDVAKLFGMEQGYGGLDNLTLTARVQTDADLATLQTFAEKSQAGSPVLNSLKTAATVVVEKV